jgi:hypothetical protein
MVAFPRALAHLHLRVSIIFHYRNLCSIAFLAAYLRALCDLRVRLLPANHHGEQTAAIIN